MMECVDFRPRGKAAQPCEVTGQGSHQVWKTWKFEKKVGTLAVNLAVLASNAFPPM